MNFCNEAKITVMYSQIRNNYFALILSEKDQGIMMDRTLDRKKKCSSATFSAMLPSSAAKRQIVLPGHAW